MSKHPEGNTHSIILSWLHGFNPAELPSASLQGIGRPRDVWSITLGISCSALHAAHLGTVLTAFMAAWLESMVLNQHSSRLRHRVTV